MQSRFLLLSGSDAIILSLNWVVEECRQRHGDDLGFSGGQEACYWLPLSEPISGII